MRVLNRRACEAGFGKALKTTSTPIMRGGAVPPKPATASKAGGKDHRSKRHTPEQIVSNLREAHAMLNAGKNLAAVHGSSLYQRFSTADPTCRAQSNHDWSGPCLIFA